MMDKTTRNVILGTGFAVFLLYFASMGQATAPATKGTLSSRDMISPGGKRLNATSHNRDVLFKNMLNQTPLANRKAPNASLSAPVLNVFQAPFFINEAHLQLDFCTLVPGRLCADPLLNRVKWELYSTSHHNDFITRKLSETNEIHVMKAWRNFFQITSSTGPHLLPCHVTCSGVPCVC